MPISIDSDKIESDQSISILDFDISTEGIELFTSHCKVTESKQSTYTITNCGLTDCTTVNCTTVNCTTVRCTAQEHCSNDG